MEITHYVIFNRNKTFLLNIDEIYINIVLDEKLNWKDMQHAYVLYFISNQDISDTQSKKVNQLQLNLPPLTLLSDNLGRNKQIKHTTIETKKCNSHLSGLRK